jgi:hypothetical protein
MTEKKKSDECPACHSWVKPLRNLFDGELCPDPAGWHTKPTTEVIRCPFPPDMAEVTLVREYDDRLRIPTHEIVRGISRYGKCPASLMNWPLDQDTTDLLGDLYESYLRERTRQEQADKPPAAPVSPTPHRGDVPVEQDRRPHPSVETPKWFRPGPAGASGNRHHPGLNVRDERMLPGEPGRPVGRPDRWPAQDYSSGGDGRVRHNQCGREHLPGQPCQPGPPKPPSAPAPAGTVTPIRRDSAVSKMDEARGANDAAVQMMQEAMATLAAVREQVEQAQGMFLISHAQAEQAASGQALEMVGATLERLSEAMSAAAEAVDQAGNIQF